MQNLLLIRKLFGLSSVKSGIIYDLTMLKSLKFKETNKLMLKNNAG